MKRISTLDGHKRMSTRELLAVIARAVAAGETDFHIAASGQHDIGGPLWSREGRPLRFTVSNPGQRVGAMCMPGSTIIVEGPAPADVGWLNSGGLVVVKGDAGDTAGHCAAGGKIFIGGRAGARSGSLMKHDPAMPEPELWILDSVGSFSFEFMGGGKAVVCGHDSMTLPSVLGERPCVGMVGGTVYFRGPAPELPPDVVEAGLDEADMAWLNAGLDEFLESIGKPKFKRELSLWKHWHKLVRAPERPKQSLSMKEFREKSWFSAGLFGDVAPDDLQVIPLLPRGEYRLAAPLWRSAGHACEDCRACLKVCPRAAIRREGKGEVPVYSVNAERCIGCGLCAAICPSGVWTLDLLPPPENI